ncbi:uncharacterized protein LOC144498758 isoform X2 [Mustelus asterias]
MFHRLFIGALGSILVANSLCVQGHPLVTSAKNHDIITGDVMSEGSKSPSLSPEPAESPPHSSSPSGIHSTEPPSVENSSLLEEQTTRPKSSVTPVFTVKRGPLPTMLEYVTNSLSKTTLAMHVSRSAGDRTPYIGSSRKIPLNMENQVTEAKLEHHSDRDLTTLGSIVQPSPSAVISGNATRMNATIGTNKVNIDKSDFSPTLEGLSMLQTNTKSEHENMSGVTSTWSSETTQTPTKFDRQGGTSAIPMTPNPTELPEGMTTHLRIFSSRPLLDHRSVKTSDGRETFTVTASAEQTVERESTPEIPSSASAKVHLDLMTATVFDTKWMPSKASSPDPSSLTVESGSTSEILSSEPTLSEYSTALGDNRRFSISVSPEPAILFVESGSTPEILRSEPPGLVNFPPDFTATTDAARVSTSQQTGPNSGEESDLPASTTLQDVEIKQTPTERLPVYSSTTAMSSSTVPDRLTASLFHSPEASSINDPINANEKREINPPTTSSKQSTGQLKFMTPGTKHATRIYSTSNFGWIATTRVTTNQVTQMPLFTEGMPHYAEPTSTETSDLFIVDNEPNLKFQPTTAVGEKPLEVSLDWLIVVGIIASLLIIVIGGLVIIYSKRLCGRKKTLAITRPREDNAAIMENGNGRDLVDEGGLKADIKRSDEWIQLMKKDDVEVVSESAEAARLMSGEEAGEVSNTEMMTATQEQENRS